MCNSLVFSISVNLSEIIKKNMQVVAEISVFIGIIKRYDVLFLANLFLIFWQNKPILKLFWDNLKPNHLDIAPDLVLEQLQGLLSIY